MLVKNSFFSQDIFKGTQKMHRPPWQQFQRQTGPELFVWLDTTSGKWEMVFWWLTGAWHLHRTVPVCLAQVFLSYCFSFSFDTCVNTHIASTFTHSPPFFLGLLWKCCSTLHQRAKVKIFCICSSYFIHLRRDCGTEARSFLWAKRRQLSESLNPQMLCPFLLLLLLTGTQEHARIHT